jgi:hypothetical protein
MLQTTFARKKKKDNFSKKLFAVNSLEKIQKTLPNYDATHGFLNKKVVIRVFFSGCWRKCPQ